MGSTALAQVARRWQQQITSSPEYAVVAHDNTYRLGMSPSSIGETRYHACGNLLTELLGQYEGIRLEDAIPGKEQENREGGYYRITHSETFPQGMLAPFSASHLLFRQLDLVKGVGEKRMHQFRSRGIRTLQDMMFLRRYAPDAGDLTVLIAEEMDSLYLDLKKRKGPSHPLTLLGTARMERERFRFIDIETMGLFGRPVILIGVAAFTGDTLQSTQLLLRDIGEECAALTALHDLIPPDAVLVSFNGRCFDIPYLQERMHYYGLDPLPEHLHVDLLHPSRRVWRREGHDCRLSTLEQRYLGISRHQDLPGMLVPEWYNTYLHTRNPGPLLPIVTHNRQDVISLAYLFDLLRRRAGEWYTGA